MTSPQPTGNTGLQPEERVFVSFGVRGDNLDPVQVTQLLGIQPSRSYARGEKYITRVSRTQTGERVHPVGVWQISSETAVVSDGIQEHLDYIADLIGPKHNEIGLLLTDPSIYVDVRLWVESMESVHSFTLRSESVLCLAALCRDFNISVIGK
jgi:hypothetical protein